MLDIDPPEDSASDSPSRRPSWSGQALAESGLAGAVKTSGAKGVHIFVPIAGASTEEVAAATRALAARAERLDPALATTAFVRDDRGGKVFLDSTRAGGATVVVGLQPAAATRRAGVVSGALGRARRRHSGRLHRAHRTGVDARRRSVGGRAAGAAGSCSAELIDEGRTIPIARVQAMHEGKRRARELRAPQAE